MAFSPKTEVVVKHNIRYLPVRHPDYQDLYNDDKGWLVIDTYNNGEVVCKARRDYARKIAQLMNGREDDK